MWGSISSSTFPGGGWWGVISLEQVNCLGSSCTRNLILNHAAGAWLCYEKPPALITMQTLMERGINLQEGCQVADVCRYRTFNSGEEVNLILELMSWLTLEHINLLCNWSLSKVRKWRAVTPDILFTDFSSSSHPLLPYPGMNDLKQWEPVCFSFQWYSLGKVC